MKCVKCNKNVEQEHLYCPYCAEPNNNRRFGNNSINAGKNNINIGLGNNSNQEIYIDNLNVTRPTDELIIEYSDRLDRKVIGGVNGFKRKFEISGILSVVSAVVTITDYLLTKSNYRVLLLMSTIGLIAYAFDSREKFKELRKNRIVYRDKKPILFEEENGEVYKVKKYGICPICDGRVYIYNDEKFKRKLGKCVNNNDHLYTYDHTIDAGVPYMVIDFHHTK